MIILWIFVLVAYKVDPSHLQHVSFVTKPDCTHDENTSSYN